MGGLIMEKTNSMSAVLLSCVFSIFGAIAIIGLCYECFNHGINHNVREKNLYKLPPIRIYPSEETI